MDAPDINMLTEEQLKELLDIRSQMNMLQARYDDIVRKSMHSTLAVAPAPAVMPASAATLIPTLTPVTAAPTPAAAPALAPAPLRDPAPTYAAPASPPRPSPVAAPAPKAEELAPVKVDGSVTANVRRALVQILTDAAKPLPFNSIYSKLQASGTPLPEVKPLIVVRKMLHDTTLFGVTSGMFHIKSDVPLPDAAPAIPAPAAPAPAVSPAPAAPAVAVSPTPVALAPIPLSPPSIGGRPIAAAPKPAPSFSSRLDAILNQ